MTRRDDDLPAELRDVAAQVRALGREEWEPAAPPPLRAPGDLAARPPRRGRRRAGTGRLARPLVLRPALAAAAALVLVALGAAGALLVGGDDNGAPGREVVLAPVGDGPRGARADARLQSAAMHLTVSGLPRVAGGGFYEVWMLRDPAAPRRRRQLPGRAPTAAHASTSRSRRARAASPCSTSRASRGRRSGPLRALGAALAPDR